MSTTTFDVVLDHVRALSKTEAQKGRLFERVMKAYFEQAPNYKARFQTVWLWKGWRAHYQGLTGMDLGPDRGIDLVAENFDGEYCAIQCKCYAAQYKVSKKDVDSFLSDSGKVGMDGAPIYAHRIFVSTGAGFNKNASDALYSNRPRTQPIQWGDLIAACDAWPDLAAIDPESWRMPIRRYALRPHQEAAIKDITDGLAVVDQGSLIMACGTGKTFTALRLAEQMAGEGKRVLFLAPSINLVGQTMREWANQAEVAQRPLCVCSDASTGKDDESGQMEDLEMPPTTDAAELGQALRQRKRDRMTVVFSTYQSTQVIVEAQQEHGAPFFDLILCDEAHRTAGVDRAGDDVAAFQLVHHKDRLKGRKRLYMTATPKVFGDGIKNKVTARQLQDAAKPEVDAAGARAAASTLLYSMDDEAVFGKVLHKLSFSDAINQNLLADYHVSVLCLDERLEPAAAQHLGTSGMKELSLSQASLLVGAWRAMQHPGGNAEAPPLRRAIAYTRTIGMSKRLANHWSSVVQAASERIEDEQESAEAQRFQAEHTDGQQNALERKNKIAWLSADIPEGESRILCNAKCLQEGVDVPALDAAIFVEPKRSAIDIAQAVGRVMRKADGKGDGHILIPVVVKEGVSPEDALNDNKAFAPVWAVLRALRSHDDRLDIKVNQINLTGKMPDNVSFHDLRKRREERAAARERREAETARQAVLAFPPLDVDPNAICAKLVEKCGDRLYWPRWSEDVARVFEAITQRVSGVLEDDGADGDLQQWMDGVVQDLRKSLNSTISTESAIEMLAQHIITRPVFDALFGHYDFAASNPISKDLERLRQDFEQYGLEAETRDLKPFYESIRKRVTGLDSPDARQKVLLELYDTFFQRALPKEAQRNGVVYTPTEVVDFILRSVDDVLRQEFGRGLTAKGVHVLDPFAGTGVFPSRMLTLPKLIRTQDLHRKFTDELHANEIMLLAYYLATVSVEEAYHGRAGGDYLPFEGAVLTDTFNVESGSEIGLFGSMMEENNERVRRQRDKPIKVIVGNPPYSAGQRSSADDNQNIVYPKLRQRIQDTYARHTSATLKKSLFDSYKKAFRWATDRLDPEEGGVIAFVSNGSWLGGNADAGVRACLADEFTTIYVVNMRGNIRKFDKAEGENVFGNKSMTPITITILVRNPSAAHDGCRILYHDIGDYLKRTDKLRILRDTESIAGIDDWREIAPNRHHDWIDQRSEDFQRLYPLGIKAMKSGKGADAIFQLFSLGYLTGRDTYLYNFSRESCAENARLAAHDYMSAMQAVGSRPPPRLDEIVRLHAANIRWDHGLKESLVRKKEIVFSAANVQKTHYRPFVQSYCYVEYVLATRKYQMDSIFPMPDGDNRAICVPGVGSTKPFSALVTDSMPDLELISKGQCFPRYRYQAPSAQDGLPGLDSGLERIDNITDAALRRFRAHYGDPSITKDTIFDYVYGILHHPGYRARFANDFSKTLPRIPFAPNFHAFAQAGAELMALHLGYETCPEHPLTLDFKGEGAPRPEHFRIDKNMRWENADRNAVTINQHITLRGIPKAAHRYEVNGRTPLDWLLNRYTVKTDKQSGILNDANGWFEDDPTQLVNTFRRITHLSLDTVQLVDGLAGLEFGV